MKKEHAIALVNALALVRPFTPPLVYDQIVMNPAFGTLVAAAGGQIELQVRPPISDEPGRQD